MSCPVSDPEVSAEVVGRLRGACLGLPEAFEEAAWVGTRWKVRANTFAHVLTVEGGWPEAYAKAFGLEHATEPVVVLTFRALGVERDALVGTGHPFHKPPWSPDVVGMVITEDTDWDEVAELLIESFCAVAPRKLVEKVERPS